MVTSSVRNDTCCYRLLLGTVRGRAPSGVLLLNSVLCRNPQGSLPGNCTPGRIVTVLGPLGSGLLYIENGYRTRISRVILSFPIVTSCGAFRVRKGALCLDRNRVCGGRGLPGVGGNSVLLGNRARIPRYVRIKSVVLLGYNSISVPGRRDPRDCVVCRGGRFS